MRFYLRPQARFSDGTPVTAEDVVFTFETLVSKGDPMYRNYYADVDKVVAEDKLACASTSSTPATANCR